MERVALLRLCVCVACLLGSAHCSRVVTGQKEALGPEPMITAHELDLVAGDELGHVVHTEENCNDCYQGDIVVPEESDLPPSSLSSAFIEEKEQEGYNMTQEWLVRGGKPWPNGIVYYKFKEGTAAKAMEVALAAMRIWEQKTCILFRESSTEPSFKRPVTIRSDGNGCYANAGYYNSKKQQMNLGEGCHLVGVALHELGHVIGLSHEQERANRDEYVRINEQNIQPDMVQWFKKEAWRDEATASLPYDLSSIMHYDAWAFALKQDFTEETQTITVLNKDSYGNCRVGQRTELSIGDQLTVSVLYGCPHPPTNAKASAFEDPTCQDDPKGWSGIACPKVTKLKAGRYCEYQQLQALCPKSCGNCAHIPFCY
mmetsp:Transcript_43351/g.97626  ORF Transcript_43351/g.97626 Transcript_43351/m.97626 type:complete len:371 (+) Transcript_43351:90-1202(+)